MPLTENWVFNLIIIHYWHYILIFNTALKSDLFSENKIIIKISFCLKQAEISANDARKIILFSL